MDGFSSRDISTEIGVAAKNGMITLSGRVSYTEVYRHETDSAQYY